MAAGFVGVEAVVADGLLSFGWDVEEGGGVERAEGFAVSFFVTSEELVPAVVDELTSSRQSGVNICYGRFMSTGTL